MAQGILINDTLTLGLKRVENETPQLLQKAAGVMAIMLLKDSDSEQPATPVRTRELVSSGSAFANNTLVHANSGPGTPLTSLNESFAKDEAVGTVVYNADHALIMHEGVDPRTGKDYNYHTPGTGAKFLINKAVGNKDKYYSAAARVIRGGLGR